MAITLRVGSDEVSVVGNDALGNNIRLEKAGFKLKGLLFYPSAVIKTGELYEFPFLRLLATNDAEVSGNLMSLLDDKSLAILENSLTRTQGLLSVESMSFTSLLSSGINAGEAAKFLAGEPLTEGYSNDFPAPSVIHKKASNGTQGVPYADMSPPETMTGDFSINLHVSAGVNNYFEFYMGVRVDD